jgi:hypothetical protein
MESTSDGAYFMARLKPIVPIISGNDWDLKRFNIADLLDFGKLNFGTPTVVPIVSNAITIQRSSFVRVSSPSYNELRNILGGESGDVIVMTKNATSDQFQLTNTGNIKIPYWLYASNYFTAALLFDGTSWRTFGFSANT